MPGLQGQEQSWDGNGGISMGVAETPAQAQDTAFLQERLLMLTQVGQAAGRVSPTGNPGYQRAKLCPPVLGTEKQGSLGSGLGGSRSCGGALGTPW